MPHFTPSRLAVVVLTLSLLTFLWSFGLPSPVASPALNQGGNAAPQSPAKGKEENIDNLEVPEFDFDRFNPERESEKGKSGVEVTPTVTLASVDVASSMDVSTPTTPTPSPSAKPEEKKKPQDGAKVEQETTSVHGDTPKEQKETVSESAAKAEPTPVPAATTPENNGTATAEAKTTATPVVESSLATVPTPSAAAGPEYCKHVHRAADVMVVIKTSKAEIKDKLPTHLKTLLSCVPDFVIFSDHAGKIGDIPIHDVLESVSDSAKQSHAEFKDYQRIKTEEDVKPGSVNKDLDKWKILPMVYRAYQMRPNARFYMFIEADTSLSWANLLQWIDRLDYRIAYYSGAPNTLDKIRFAQRGAGILLSQGALRLYAKGYTELYASKWEARIGKECCGDAILATAMQDSRVEFYSSFPLIQGETPWTLDWTERHWCAPMLTWHHMAPQDVVTLWERQLNWTAKHGWTKPYLFRDAFAELIAPHLVDVKQDWDNISADSKITKEDGDKDGGSEWAKHSEDLKKSIESPEGCKRVCEISADCLQWKFSTRGSGECYVGKVVRFGRAVASTEGGGRWTSGWMRERIGTKTAEWDCKAAKWKFGQ